MGTDDAEAPKTHEVPNPEYTELVALKNAVTAAQDELGTALKAAAAQMSGGSAWTGPTTATAFTQEISGRSTKLPGLVEQILQAVEARMREVPKTLTEPVGAHGGPMRAI